MSCDFDFSETSGRDFFDFQEFFFVARDVDVRDPETFGRVDSVLDVVVVGGDVEGAAMELILGHVFVVSDVAVAQKMPERKKRITLLSKLYFLYICVTCKVKIQRLCNYYWTKYLHTQMRKGGGGVAVNVLNSCKL